MSRPRTLLSFRPPDVDVLQRVEADCRALRIPTYAELKGGPYWRTYNAYLLAQDWSEQNVARDQFWFAISTVTGTSPAVLDAFRKNDKAYERWLQCRECVFESASYLMGLYMARREFPRLGGGVL